MTQSRAALFTLLACIGTAAVSRADQRTTTPAPTGQAAVTTPAGATAQIAAAAQAVLASLDPAGRARVQYGFDSPQRSRWSNLPTGIFQREGLRLADLTAAQRSLVTTLLQTALSREGYRKVTEIMLGDEVLKGTGGGRGGRGGPTFGKDEYFLAFIGTPSATQPWMLQFGGHHLAINLTMAGRQATMAPSLPAAQPATFTIEGRTVRPLGRENDKAFALINALDEGQRRQAILPYRVSDLVLGATQDGKTIQPEGLRASSLTPAQQGMLLDVVSEWVGIMHGTFAEARLAEIRSTIADTYFAWSGPTTNGSAAYFRIQGPTLVIEYAPQGGVDHIHTIYRDPTNDYGARFARR